MFGLTPLAPWFLWGLAAVSVPVVIHMLQSPTAKIIDFPCIRFLKACQKKAVRRTRLKNIILMLMRMAIIALIAFGMAKPQRFEEQTDVLPDAPVSMVVVLDNSYSMGYVDKGRSRFEQALEAALGLLGTLKPGDEVALLLMNEQCEPLLPDFTADHERARAALRGAKLSDLGTNADPALREAIRLAAKAASIPDSRSQIPDADKKERRRLEIHILTDLQALAWEPVLKSGYLKNVDTKATIYVTSFGRKGSANCFVESVAVAGAGPEQCSVTAQVWAVGAGAPGGVATLSVNDKPVAQETFAVRPGAPTPVTLTTRLGAAGSFRCVLSLQDDALTADDKHFFTVKVGERSKVLVVDGDPSAIGPLAETFYLGNALNPGGAAAGVDGPPPVDARVVSIAELPSVKLDDYRIVLLCNVASLGSDDPVRLDAFLRGGGSLWVFLGGKANAQEYNSPQWSFLPTTLTQPVGDATKKQTFEFGETREGHPLFKTKLDLRAARFWLCWGTDRASLKPGAAVLQSFTNGQPALVEGQGPGGKGKVLLFTSAADSDWGNFPLRRAYLPWVHNAIYYLSGADVRGSSFKLKEEVKFQALATHYKERITVTPPGGTAIGVPVAVKEGYAEGVFKNTDVPGLYQVKADPAFTHSGGFGANLNVQESIITMEDPEKIAAAAPSGLLKFVEGPKRDVVEEVKKSREGQDYWPLIFKLALLVFVVESLFGNLVSRAGKPGGLKLPLFEVLRRRNPGVSQ
ncbi:MAG: VWA domain-containing protein [Planctomycetes bacterium]|nr:VWA domain-containing protein [Planctomycetota bacterium]